VSVDDARTLLGGLEMSADAEQAVGSYRLTEAGKIRARSDVDAQRASWPGAGKALDEFIVFDRQVKDVVTSWQMRDAQTVNDHADAAYDASVLTRLNELHSDISVWLTHQATAFARLDGYLDLKRHAQIPIAGGECEYTRYGFRELINGRAVDILQPDLCAMGGFSEMLKVIAMASAANLPVIPHVWGTSVGLAAALQLFAALPHFPERRFPAEPLFEYDRSPHPFRDGVTREQFAMREGYLDIPERPGLGVERRLPDVFHDQAYARRSEPGHGAHIKVPMRLAGAYQLER
jgi:hypothetical protein